MQSHGIVQHIFDNICYYMFHMYVLIYLMDISMRKSMLHWSRKHTVHWSISGGWLWLKLGQEFIFQPQEFPQLYYHSLKERTIMSVFIVQLIGVWTTVRAETHRGFPLLPVNTVRLAEQVSKQKRELLSASPAGMIRNPRHLPPSPVNPTMEYI